MTDDDAGAEPRRVRQLDAIRQETRWELQLLHERVNALLAAETFLTIAYTATRASGGAWTGLVAPTLSAFGLLLALLAWPGVCATSRLVMTWTLRTGDLLEQHPEGSAGSFSGQDHRRRREADQRRGLLFFRAVPAMLVVLWIVLLLSALLQRR